MPYGPPRKNQHRAAFRAPAYKRVDIGVSSIDQWERCPDEQKMDATFSKHLVEFRSLQFDEF